MYTYIYCICYICKVDLKFGGGHHIAHGVSLRLRCNPLTHTHTHFLMIWLAAHTLSVHAGSCSVGMEVGWCPSRGEEGAHTLKKKNREHTSGGSSPDTGTVHCSLPCHAASLARPVPDGSTYNGSTYDGSTHNGSTHNGSTKHRNTVCYVPLSGVD